MGDVINFRRAKKAKARLAREDQASANRAKFGTPRSLRELNEAQREKQQRDIDAHKRDGED